MICPQLPRVTLPEVTMKMSSQIAQETGMICSHVKILSCKICQETKTESLIKKTNALQSTRHLSQRSCLVPSPSDPELSQGCQPSAGLRTGWDGDCHSFYLFCSSQDKTKNGTRAAGLWRVLTVRKNGWVWGEKCQKDRKVVRDLREPQAEGRPALGPRRCHR